MDAVWIRFVMAILAAWRVGHLVARDDGPWNVFRSLRRSGLRVFTCFSCVTVWAAAALGLFVVGPHLAQWLVCTLAVAGGAALLDRATSPPFQVEFDDELLREHKRDSQHHHA